MDYKYDVWGNLIERDVDDDGDGVVDDTAQYALDGWDPAKGSPTGLENYDVLADLDGSGSLTTRYLHGDDVDQLFARVDAGGGGLWYSTDHLGSVWGLVDNAGGDQVMSVQYDTFGHISLQTGSVELGRYTWTGRELDSVTGLQYNRARWYDPQLGRWISQDPMGFAAGDSNLYRYVNNKPVMSTDPSGMQEADIVIRPVTLGKVYDDWVKEFGLEKATALYEKLSEVKDTSGATSVIPFSDLKNNMDTKYTKVNAKQGVAFVHYEWSNQIERQRLQRDSCPGCPKRENCETQRQCDY